ncbi:MAG: hypothetical protein SGILL_002132, partial [Bacillariaceae sp.]
MSSDDKSNDTTMATEIEKQHLGWTAKQGYILSGGGKAEEYYTADRGFPFVETDLPHYHLLKGDANETFVEWKASKPPCDLVCGAWNRPLFVGGWKHSSDQEERTYNVQTHNLFIDLRVPRSREIVLKRALDKGVTSLEDLTPHELRLYARQHVFAGFTVSSEEEHRAIGTRHHCMDWNFVGVSRPRPNKWWIEVNDNDASAWKEYAYAKDNIGQHYYFERWERLQNGAATLDDGEEGQQRPTPTRLALRLAPSRKRKADKNAVNTPQTPSHQQQDAILVLVGDHFNYIKSRKFMGREKLYADAGNLVNLVDAAVANGDLTTARSWLSIEAGHGTVSSGWKLDCAIPPWNEGKTLSSVMGGGLIEVKGEALNDCSIVWNGQEWDLFDCNIELVSLKTFLQQLSPHTMNIGNPMAASVEYTLTKNDDDLEQILELQRANLKSELTAEEEQAQGFVSAQHDLDTLRVMHQAYPHIVAKTVDDGKVVGYALCMMRSVEERIAILAGIFQKIDAGSHRNRSLKDQWNYFVMGQ